LISMKISKLHRSKPILQAWTPLQRSPDRVWSGTLAAQRWLRSVFPFAGEFLQAVGT
jgi:hypothetical protein